MPYDNPSLTWDDFMKPDIRTGTILFAEAFPEARKPAYKITIDFGEIGIKRTSAQVTGLYATDDLIGKQVVAVVNFPPKQIANFISECLLLGAVDGNYVTLLTLDLPVRNGLRIG
ncbi:MAG: tRNA-binding protein [Saprospiraceae bacterium]|nr:tRNA-binding protein [Saprospiraceae bacterium]MBX7178154.1 tRNA-binding protein [Saprospiraceae bacterium]MCB0590493.1 tRNA-binding protein [Saprospiraceae bacterium]MCO6470745.1 tRNA-binding protein [Saprospiraceae bacterium]HMZ25608.1 tRNA-binding protein [Saprospiraceae bacterium]